MNTATVAIEVNRQILRKQVPARMHLGDFVREEGRQTGTHLGCEHGVCGACTVLVEGRPVRSCITFASACDSQRVTTVEGHDGDPVMALLRKAFSEHHGLQCGFCTPGMLTTARDIVLRLPEADEARVRLELAGNLCRCTGYLGIVNAILDVLQQCRGAGVPEVTALRAALPAPQGGGTHAPRKAFRTFVATNTGAIAATASAQEHREEASSIQDINQDIKASKGGTHIQGHFTVPYPAETVWAFMTDLPLVASCLPGAELSEHTDDRVKGHIAIKFGPMAASFQGAAKLERDEATRSAVLKGAGQDSVSKSRANGDVSYRLVPLQDGGTRVEVDLLYSLQGPLAQFSRSGLVKDFVGRMIQDFGRNVSLRLDPNRTADTPLPSAQLNAIGLVSRVIWARIKRLFGRGH